MESLREKEYFDGKYYLLVPEEDQDDYCMGCCFYKDDGNCGIFQESILTCATGVGSNGIYKNIEIEKFKKKKLII